MLAACGGAAPAGEEAAVPAPLAWDLAFEPLDLPSPEGSGYPQLTASSRGVILSWIELGDEGATLRFAERGGDGWSAPRTAATGEDWFVTTADVPTVLRLRDGTLVAHWYPTLDALLEAYNLEMAYSRDDGATWSPPFLPHHDGTSTQHGFASPFEMPGGGLGLVWLDGRDMETSTAPEGGSMAVYFARFDSDWQQVEETLVDQRVCECCQTSVAVGGDAVVAAFRDRDLQEIRDINVSRLENGAWTAARPLHVDRFHIEACPVNGPALSARGDRVAAAWFAAPDADAHAFAAFSEDGGRTWGEPIRLDEVTTLGHVDVELLADGSAVASWMEFAEGRSRLMARRVDASGARSDAMPIPGANRINGYPRMTLAGDDLVMAWAAIEDDGQWLRAAVAHAGREAGR
jgi:hypothetical protein